jgi:glycosyltransferase involved in cell wall biosynthesis
MNVVFVHPSHPNQFTGIAHALSRKRGWECAFLVDRAFAGQVRQDGPAIAYYGYGEEASPLSGTYYTRCIEEGARRGKAIVEALAHIHASTGIDAVVGHASFGATLFVREILKVPVVSYVELPGYYPAFCREEFPGRYPQSLMDVALRSLIHSSVIHSDLCVVPSAYARNLFPPELRGKVRVRMEGFDVPPAATDRESLRRELGIAGEGPVIGFAGRTLEAVRGFDVFVRAAGKIRTARPDAHFLVVGDEASIYGNETSYLGGVSFKRHVLRHEGMDDKDFIFRPFVPHDQFVRYLQAMDVILFPLFEGAANWGVFEAMAAGVPVIASRRCFLPEVIEDGRDGILLETMDADGFAAAALGLMEDNARSEGLARSARQKIARSFSVERAASGYAAIIREAVRRHGNGMQKLSRVPYRERTLCPEA